MDREEPGRLQSVGLQSRTQRKQLIKGFLGGASGKEPPAKAGDIKRHVRSLSQEDPLEEGMATYTSILA